MKLILVTTQIIHHKQNNNMNLSKDELDAIKNPIQLGDLVNARPGYMVSHSHNARVTRILHLGNSTPKIKGGDWIELNGDKACMPRFKYIKATE